MKKAVLVTGAAGFIGRHTARVLNEAGFVVHGLGLGRFEDAIDRYGLTSWHEGAVTLDNLTRCVATCGTPCAIVHCAGKGSVTFSLEHPRDDFTGNVNTTLDILEFARLHKGVRVVIPSSAAVYGMTANLPIKETEPANPISPYGFHKLMAEHLCEYYARTWNISVTIVRLFSIYGPELRKQLLWDACCKAGTATFVFFGDGQEQRDWLHVRDAARLLALAIHQASPSCPVINGGSGQGVTTREILTLLGRYLRPNRVPAFSGKNRTGDPSHYIADCTRLRAWNFKPSVALEEGLEEYTKWFYSHKEHL